MKHHPFTLFEVLVAMTLLAAVAALTTVALGTVAGSWERSEGQAARLREALTLDRTLDNILANTIPYPWPDAAGTEVDQTHGDVHTLVVATAHAAPRRDHGSVRFIRLARAGDRLVADYCERPPFAAARELRRSVLATGVEEVRFAYCEVVEGKLCRRPSWRDRAYPPAAIEVTVRWQDGRRGTWFRRTAGSGRREQFGAALREDDR